MDWDISAIATVSMSGVILATAIIALGQLREIQKSRRSDAFTNLVQFLQREDIREARRILIRELSKKSFNSWTPDERQKAEMACHTYAAAGMMEEEGYVKKGFIAKEWHNSIVQCWEAAEPMITEYRDDRGKDFWFRFERLYKRAKKYEEALKQKDIRESKKGG